MEFHYDTWDDTKIRQLFLPLQDEHPLDAIAGRIDALVEARTTEKGYKLVIEGGDPFDTCTDLDIIFILEKSMYLVSALTIALTSYPTKTWLQCCEDASNTCKVFATPYRARSVMNWWQEF